MECIQSQASGRTNRNQDVGNLWKTLFTQRPSETELLALIEGEVNGDPERATQLLYVLTNESRMLLNDYGRDLASNLGNVHLSEKQKTTFLSIAYYVAGNIAKESGPSYKINTPGFYFSKSAELGYAPALKPLSDSYLSGEHLVAHDAPSYMALEILEAASSSNPDGPAKTGNKHVDELLQNLAENKDERATFQLYRLNYELHSYEAAKGFLELSAEKEYYPEAINEMTKCFMYGDVFLGIAKDAD